MSPGDSMRLSALEAFVLRWSVALFTLAGLLVGTVLFSLRTPVYESQTVISVVNPIGTMADEAQLVRSDAVVGTATAGLGFDPDIDVEANEVADLLTITVRADDPDDAAQAATRLAEAYTQAQTTVAVRVADAAEPDPSPVAPNRLVYMVVGSALGAVVGAGVAGILRVRQFMPARTTAGGRLTPIRPARRPSTSFAQQLASANELDGPERAGYDAHERLVEPAAATLVDLTADDDTIIDVRDPLPRPTMGFDPPEGGAALDLTDSAGPDDGTANDAGDPHGASRSNVEPPPISAPAEHDPTKVTMTSRPSGTTVKTSGPATTFVDQLDPGGSAAPSSDPLTPPLAEDARPDPVDAPRFVTDHVESQDSASSPPPKPPRFVTDPVDAPPTEGVAAQRPVDGGLHSAIADALEIAEARFEARFADQAMAHEEALSTVSADHERQVIELKRDLADARKAARTANAQAQRLSGDDQHRIGDLEAQVNALESEISGLRTQLESERIAHLRELTNERDAADRNLDEARRGFREQIEANDQAGRDALTVHRNELDSLLAQQRAEHQAELDRQHREHEAALARLRQRRKDDLTTLSQRHREEMATFKAEGDENASRLIRQTKQSIAELRTTEKRMAGQIEQLEEAEQAHRAEAALLRTSLQDAERKLVETERTLRDELSETTQALESERERNAALREDVVRRTAEAHQAVDRAIDDRSQQLAELEALVARQREHAEERIREANDAAEDRSRAAARREAELHARIVRLERELDERRPQTG